MDPKTPRRYFMIAGVVVVLGIVISLALMTWFDPEQPLSGRLLASGGIGVLTALRARRSFRLDRIDKSCSRANRSDRCVELERYVSRHPADSTLRFHLANAYLESGRYEQAVKAFQVSQRDTKHAIRSRLGIGVALHQMGMYEQAIHALRHVCVSSGVDSSLRKYAQYRLMLSLKERASSTKDIAMASEASTLVTALALDDIEYYDVKQRAVQISDLLSRLRSDLSRSAA